MKLIRAKEKYKRKVTVGPEPVYTTDTWKLRLRTETLQTTFSAEKAQCDAYSEVQQLVTIAGKLRPCRNVRQTHADMRRYSNHNRTIHRLGMF